MNEKTLNMLMVGLPGTGKTTFLAALWHVLCDPANMLYLKELPLETEYINGICDKWINCEPLERTIQGSHNIIHMKVNDRASHKTMELIFPDLSGETFREQLNHRQWKKNYEQLVLQAAGLFLFIHPSAIIDSQLIGEADKLLGELIPEEPIVANEYVTKTSDAATQWDIEEMGTQVKLVELLQLHIDYIRPNQMPRVVIIVSAWDLVENQYRSPEEFVKRRLPLLDQYLLSNSDLVPSTLFGISAQGGDLLSDKTKLLKNIRPADRIKVRDKTNNESEITAPIKWLMMC